MKLKQTPVPT